MQKKSVTGLPLFLNSIFPPFFLKKVLSSSFLMLELMLFSSQDGNINTFHKNFEHKVSWRHIRLTGSMSIYIYTHRFDYKSVTKTNFISSKLNKKYPSLQTTAIWVQQQFRSISKITVNKRYISTSQEESHTHIKCK